MSDEQRWTVPVLIAALVASATLAAPGAALSADATVDDPAPGAVGDYTVTLRAEEGDAVTENGLKSVTLDFGADRDYSGDLGNLTARDVEVRVGDENGTVWAGQTNVSQNGSEVTITLEQAFEDVRPDDRIVVRVFGVTNTEIALRNAQTLRGFAVRASATDPEGDTDGPVEARYAIDPNATAAQTPTAEPNSSDSDSGSDDVDNGTSTEIATIETAETTEAMTSNDTTNGTATSVSAASENATAMGTEATTATETTEATRTDTTTTTETTSTATTQPATTDGNDGGGGQATEATGPGFGLLVGIVALLAAGLLATRRRD